MVQGRKRSGQKKALQPITSIASVAQILGLAGTKAKARFREEFKKKPIMQQAAEIRVLKSGYGDLNQNMTALKAELHRALAHMNSSGRGHEFAKFKAVFFHSLPAKARHLEAEYSRLNKASGEIFADFRPGATRRKISGIEELALKATRRLVEFNNEYRRAKLVYRKRH